MVAQSTGPSERGELATTLVAACESYGSAVPLIVELSRDEISATPQEGINEEIRKEKKKEWKKR